MALEFPFIVDEFADKEHNRKCLKDNYRYESSFLIRVPLYIHSENVEN